MTCGLGTAVAQTSPSKPLPNKPGTSDPAAGAPVPSGTPGVTPPKLESGETSITVEKRLTKQQEDQLLAEADEIFRFASKDTGLPIQHSVKKVFVSRDE